MADKVKEQNQYHQQKAKYLGLGNPDTTRDEFLTTVHRDTYASLALHSPLLTYTAAAVGQHPEVMRQAMVKKMVGPKAKGKE
ncbi:uncharacterized protein CANTADRAFT_55158 [Suhomyces tanzawaensis NRRL Y-17324]|uniref:Splicing factor subunit n=1 Tax=Suhomyces tanzawaensis NRRL Y-17324 TaxID=984487 RepID=A0A1E4SEI6_9ASCO|nr:uncharacterized protein CANTADRAFT_55158 [Suhomyces tanzawaensis NRRL Y-17324]ODV77934.1 hypothetical protein CANTADRAFT_55158 [Suhomyces tanzawaensis NRRL Y-17324]